MMVAVPASLAATTEFVSMLITFSPGATWARTAVRPRFLRRLAPAAAAAVATPTFCYHVDCDKH